MSPPDLPSRMGVSPSSSSAGRVRLSGRARVNVVVFWTVQASALGNLQLVLSRDQNRALPGIPRAATAAQAA